MSSGLFDVAAQASHPVRRAQSRDASSELTESRKLRQLSEPAASAQKLSSAASGSQIGFMVDLHRDLGNGKCRTQIREDDPDER